MNLQAPDVKPIDRPVTHQGMQGVREPMDKSSAIGGIGGRKVFDKSFYLTNLKKTINDLYGELKKIKNQIDDINKNNNLYFQFEKR